jgi:hypothetical protein
MSPVLPTERIAHLTYGWRLLRCGISTRLMTAVGHLRQISTLPTLSECPLRSGRGQSSATQQINASAKCRPEDGAPAQGECDRPGRHSGTHSIFTFAALMTSPHLAESLRRYSAKASSGPGTGCTAKRSRYFFRNSGSLTIFCTSALTFLPLHGFSRSTVSTV